jgi:6-phosphogluconolactonase
MSFAVEILRDGDAVAAAAADRFVALAREAVAERGRFAVALSGGSTPKRLYQLLAAEPYRDQVAWDRVHVFWGDERSVPPDDEQSNYHVAREALLSHVPIPANQIHRMAAERADRDAAAKEYEAILAATFGLAPDGPPPAFDLVLLGLGTDGHTASLFPHTAALKETARWVVANHVPQLNTDRMTFTAALINAARFVLFLVVGADKAARLIEVVEGAHDPERLPAQLIVPAPGQVKWLADRTAGAVLLPSLLAQFRPGGN